MGPQSRQAFVSFVITVYNGARYLEACVDNLLAVEWDHFEIVVVDDGSFDETPAIGCRLEAMHPAVRFHRRERLGRGRALNAAVELAEGEFVAIQDVDDHALPWRLKATVPPLMQDERIAIVGGGWIAVDEAQWLQNLPPRPKELGTEVGHEVRPIDLYKSCILCHSGVVFRKSAWRAGGRYDETLTSCIDYEFYVRMLSVGRCLYVPTPVVLFRKANETVFKKQSHLEWLKNLLIVQKRARRLLDIPLQARINDLRPFVRVGVVSGRKLWARRGFGQIVARRRARTP